MIRNFGFLLAVREARAGFRRIGIFMLAIALGVGALTGLHAFQADAAEGARAEARSLLGGDVRIQTGSPFGPHLESILDSLATEGIRVSRTVSLGSMVSPVGVESARLLQVVAVDSIFPPGSTPEALPPDAWDRVRGGGAVAAAETTLRQLGVGAGDSLRIGGLGLEVAGAVSGLPVDPGIQTVVGPPIFMALTDLERAGLLTEGSLAQFRASLLVLPGNEPAELAAHLRGRLESGEDGYSRLSVRTAQEEAEALAEGFLALGRFLGLAAFVALLLGGVGVAGAIHLYVEERLAGVAVLRCLGARQGTVFRAYLLQAALLGLGGGVLGVALGGLLQLALPALLSPVLPYRFDPALRPSSVALGMGVGVGITVLFALLPLLRVRDVPPLAALRIEEDGGPGGSRVARLGVGALLVTGVLVLAAIQTGGVLRGIVLTGGLVAVLLLLGGLARVLMEGVRKVVPDGAPFVLRQGLAGLFRPGNQTSVMFISLGFGAFLVSSLFVVSSGLRDWLSVELDPEAPAIFLFDIQTDQREGVMALMERAGASSTLLPVVPSRIESLDGVPVEELQRAGEVPGWTLGRVYRNSWSRSLQPGDRIVAGEWWDDEEADEAVTGATPARVSLEADLARQLGIDVGSRVVWDVQGRPVESEIASLRTVDWTRFQPNFFAVFEPGSLDGAPASWIGLASLVDDDARIALQRDLVETFPNVSFLDLSDVRETIVRVSGQVTRLLGGMAVVAVGGGILVVMATLLSGRYRRRREAAILRTLGSRGRTLRGILLVEYAALGAIGGASGVLLGLAGGVAVLHFAFELPASVPLVSLGAIWVVLMLLTVLIGWTSGGSIVRRSPRAVLGAVEG